MKSKSFFFIFVAYLLASCGENTVNKQVSKVSAKSTIRLNFIDNVLDINHLRIKNETESFVCDLLYDKLDCGRPGDLLRYEYDSIRTLNKYFIDTSRYSISTADIRRHFKYLLSEKFHVKQVNEFFTSIQGIERSIWLRENRRVMDSLPDGMFFISSVCFAIKTKVDTNPLANINFFDSPYSYLTDSSDKKSFKLLKSDDDISIQLYRDGDYGLKNVELSFIKNEDQTITDFFNGNLDLIVYQPLTSQSTVHKNRLNKMIQAKYPEYHINIGNKANIIYSVLYQPQPKPAVEHIQVTDTLALVKVDSIVSFPVFNATSYKNLTINFDFPWYWTDNPALKSNPNDKYVVISEKVIDNYQGDLYIVLKDIKSSLALSLRSTDTVMIQSIWPEYYISDNTLKGMEDFNKLSTLIPHLSFKQPKTY